MVNSNLVKEAFIIGLGLLALTVILNPGAGILDLIPDNIPFIGNLDEATAVLMLSGVIQRYFRFNPLSEAGSLVSKA